MSKKSVNTLGDISSLFETDPQMEQERSTEAPTIEVEAPDTEQEVFTEGDGWEEADKEMNQTLEVIKKDIAQTKPAKPALAPGTVLQVKAKHGKEKPSKGQRPPQATLVPEGVHTGILTSMVQRENQPGGNIYRIATISPISGNSCNVFAFAEFLDDKFEYREGAVINFKYKARPKHLVRNGERLMVWQISYQKDSRMGTIINAALAGLENKGKLVTYTESQVSGMFLEIYMRDSELLNDQEISQTEVLQHLYSSFAKDYSLRLVGHTQSRAGDTYFRFLRVEPAQTSA